MAVLNDLTRWEFLTDFIKLIKQPAGFLRSLCFPDIRELDSEDVNVKTKRGARETAPFVKIGAAAHIVPGLVEGAYKVIAPNIRMKMPFTPDQWMLEVRGPSNAGSSPEEHFAAVAEAIRDDEESMLRRINNTIEWMVSQLIATGEIVYSVEGQDAFEITFPKETDAATSVIDLGSGFYWNEANGQPSDTTHIVKRRFSANEGWPVTHCILGTEASQAFQKNANVRAQLDALNISAGELTLINQFTEEGAIFLGRLYGVQFWEYDRKLTLYGGSTVDLIRPKYAEYLYISPNNGHRLYYGAIPEIDENENMILFKGRLFSKQWTSKDPASKWILAASRPFPVPTINGSMQSVKVVSG